MSNTRNDLVNDPTKESLLDLPPELIHDSISSAAHADHHYASIEATRMMATLSNTCQTMHNLFKPELDKRAENLLLTLVLQGNKTNVLHIAKTTPGLFFIKSTAMDYAMDLEGNRRTLQDWSPYQALFGTVDVDMFASVKPYLDAYLAGLPTGDALAAQQKQEKFPQGFDYPASTYDFSPLVQAINGDQQLRQTGAPSQATLDVLRKFRNDFKPGVVIAGHHFNMNDLIKAHEVYHQSVDSWNPEQIDFFSVKVIGFLERLLTAPYLQRACQGFINFTKQDQPLNRSFEVMNNTTNKKIVVVPLDSDPSCRLGEGFLIDSDCGVRCCLPGFFARPASSYAGVFGKLCQANTAELSRLACGLPSQVSSPCVIL